MCLTIQSGRDIIVACIAPGNKNGCRKRRGRHSTLRHKIVKGQDSKGRGEQINLGAAAKK